MCFVVFLLFGYLDLLSLFVVSFCLCCCLEVFIVGHPFLFHTFAPFGYLKGRLPCLMLSLFFESVNNMVHVNKVTKAEHVFLISQDRFVVGH